MIGVISKNSESAAVREFFQLFKTPWEFYVPGSNYDLVIATGEEIPRDLSASALVIYHSGPIPFDEQAGIAIGPSATNGWVRWQDTEFPVYGQLAPFRSALKPFMRHQKTLDTVGGVIKESERPTVRIGFDLFGEVAFLLSQGQPPENAQVPTLDIHISLLRAIILDLGIPFVEVPPVPAGCDFMVCLTHDVDFVGIRDHKCDHTMWGFLYRSSVGSLLKALAGKLSWSKCLQNLAAALSLPLVYLGLRKDFWLEFDRYLEIEKQFGSTFFFLPFEGKAGTLGAAAAPPRRAAKYDFTKMGEQVAKLAQNGCEVGLHGIDAWQNLQSAQAEGDRIREVTGKSDVGIRMHWLYWEESSPATLEDAGFDYDSTFGYNDAIGFRAGTTQPFCPLNTQRLLELPLNIQDTAMFYSGRMMLSEIEAMDACKKLINTMCSSGGALTVNWHTRSLSPERLWGDFYGELIKEIRRCRVRFGTAREIIAWFRKRRELRFDSVRFDENGAGVTISVPDGRLDPSLTLKYYPRRGSSNLQSGVLVVSTINAHL